MAKIRNVHNNIPWMLAKELNESFFITERGGTMILNGELEEFILKWLDVNQYILTENDGD